MLRWCAHLSVSTDNHQFVRERHSGTSFDAKIYVERVSKSMQISILPQNSATRTPGGRLLIDCLVGDPATTTPSRNTARCLNTCLITFTLLPDTPTIITEAEGLRMPIPEVSKPRYTEIPRKGHRFLLSNKNITI